MNEKISFDQIINTLVQRSSLNKSFARLFLKEMTTVIQQGLLRDSVVNLTGLGIFKLRNVPARLGRNIQTGESFTIAAHRKVLFKPEKHLREYINRNYQHLKATYFDDQENFDFAGDYLAESDKTMDSAIFNGAATESVKQSAEPKLEKNSTGTAIQQGDFIAAQSKTSPLKEEENTRLKKTPIIITLVILLSILLLYLQFSDNDGTNNSQPKPLDPVRENLEQVKEASKSTAKKRTPVPIKKAPQASISHKTGVGDNLWKLAFKYYSDGYLWPLILQANEDKISNPDFIATGTTISIPAVLNKTNNKLLAKGHLLAYREYKKRGDEDALNHLYVAYKLDKELVSASSSNIDVTDIQSMKEQFSIKS
jgi:nucleoid DNA-binding protein